MKTETTLKIALWSVPVLFGLGSFHQTVLGSSADVAEIESRLEAHEVLTAHPVTELRVSRSEEQSEQILTEQRAMRAEQSDQAQSLAAICQATGARCK